MKKKITALLVLIILLVLGIYMSRHILNKNSKINAINENKLQEEHSEGEIIHREEISDYVAKTEYGTHVNTSGEMQSTKNYKGLELNNVNLETLGSRTVMLIDVKNTTKETLNEKTVKVDLLTKDNKTIVTLAGTLQTVEPGKIAQLNLDIEGDYTNAYDYKIYE